MKKTLKWHLFVLLRLSVQNETGKPRIVGNVIVQPGESVTFLSDDVPAGY